MAILALVVDRFRLNIVCDAVLASSEARIETLRRITWLV
jgi:hypothetical protein